MESLRDLETITNIILWCKSAGARKMLYLFCGQVKTETICLHYPCQQQLK